MFIQIENTDFILSALINLSAERQSISYIHTSNNGKKIVGCCYFDRINVLYVDPFILTTILVINDSCYSSGFVSLSIFSSLSVPFIFNKSSLNCFELSLTFSVAKSLSSNCLKRLMKAVYSLGGLLISD